MTHSDVVNAALGPGKAKVLNTDSLRAVKEKRPPVLEKRPNATKDVEAMSGSSVAAQRAKYATEWSKQPGLDDLLSTLGIELPWGVVPGLLVRDQLRKKLRDVNLVDQKFSEKMQNYHKGQTPKYYTLGAGAHGGYGIGMAGAEAGAIWKAYSFGRVPMIDPISDYSTEYVTFGLATGFDIGASIDLMAFGIWFGDVGQIVGACNGVMCTGAYYGGLSVTLFWTGTWEGANGTSEPIGINIVSSAGIELGGGVFYTASATQFWNKRPDFPKT